MSYGQNPYGQNPYGQNPYGQPGSQPSAPWSNPAQPAQQPGFGAPQQAPQQGGQPWGQPSAPSPWGAPGQNPGQPARGPQGPQGPQQGGQPWGQPQAPGQGQQPGQGWGQPPAQPVPATPVPEPAPRKAEFRTRDLLVTTTESVPGREITEVLGEVIGVVTRPRDMKPSPDVKVVVTESRQDAVDAMVAMATEAGADAVIGLRFDGGKISEGTSEVTAYGTAVKLAGGPDEAPAEEPAEENPFTSAPAEESHGEN